MTMCNASQRQSNLNNDAREKTQVEFPDFILRDPITVSSLRIEST
jgi:hypothetical protein